MPGWLIDDPTLIYTLLGAAGFFFLVRWWQVRRRGPLVALAVIGVLAALETLVYHAIDSDNKRLERAVNDMAEAVLHRDPDGALAHLSDRFIVGHTDKRELRRRVEARIRQGEIHGLTVWDFQVREVDRAGRRAIATFSAKGSSSQSMMFEFVNVRATFHLDADNAWRLETFLVFAPQTDPMSNDTLPLPL